MKSSSFAYLSLTLIVLSLGGCNSAPDDSSPVPTEAAPTGSRSASPSAPAVAAVPTATASPSSVPLAVATPVAVADAPPSTDSSAQTQPSDSVSQQVADISASIRAARTPQEANAHVVASSRMAQILDDKMRENATNPDKAFLYSTWANTMRSLANAASNKQASLENPNPTIASTKAAMVDVDLNAARGGATETERAIQNVQNPQLAAQRQSDLRAKTQDFENWNTQAATR